MSRFANSPNSLLWLGIGVLLDDHAFPESDHALNVFRPRIRVRVVPSGVAIAFVAYEHVVVAGFTLPMSGGACRTLREVLASEGPRGKVVIAVDDDGRFALREQGSIPGGFHGF